jgi:tRNA-dihydrouridine synthase 1
MSGEETKKTKKPVSTEAAWTWFRDVLGSPKYVVAPMVNQSDLPFRRLCRKYGATLAYTPMLHAKLFAEPLNDRYRSQKFNTTPDEGPLIAQFCANDPEVAVQAAKMVQTQVQGIDLNLGCPQGIARKGNYGSFLLSQPDVVRSIVEALHNELDVPVSCKIRILDTGVDATIEFCRMLQAAGCSLITVHGRTKTCKKMKTGENDLDAIRRIKEAVDIPVFANGGVATFADITACMEATGVDGVMVSEMLLSNPTIFADIPMPSCTQMAREYLQMVRTSNVELFPVKPHMFRLLHPLLNIESNFDLRTTLSKARSFQEFETIAGIPDLLDAREAKLSEEEKKQWHDPMRSWYYRHASKDAVTGVITWNDGTPPPPATTKVQTYVGNKRKEHPKTEEAKTAQQHTEKKQNTNAL